MIRQILSERTRASLKFDLVKLKARWKRRRSRDLTPAFPKLHVDCGKRLVPGWLNVDVAGSQFDVDLGCGKLPWKDRSFDAIASEHCIEHLELQAELVPLCRELRRVIKPGGEIWLSCPDIEKICRSYLDHRMVDLIADRQRRWPNYTTGAVPTSHMINDMFNQWGEHKNLFDFAMLEWLLKETGFGNVRRVDEADFLTRFPEFPRRDDDPQTIYVTATAE